MPGAAQEVSLEGLSWWSDDKGAGWKTMRKAVKGWVSPSWAVCGARQEQIGEPLVRCAVVGKLAQLGEP